MAFFAAAVVTIISVVDPVGVAPLFLGLAAGMPDRERQKVVGRALVIASIMLALFAAVGRGLLTILGITVPAFSIAGGILLFLIAVDMLFARVSRTRETPEESAADRQRTDISVFPLAIPIIAGPGSITTVILYMAQAGGDVFKILAVLGSLAIALLATYLALRLSGLLFTVLGDTGVNVVGRVMGILLAALAVQFVLNGIGAFYHHGLPR